MYELDKAATLLINGWSGHSSLVDNIVVWCANDLLFLMIALVAMRWWKFLNYLPIRHTALVAGLSFILALAANMVIGLLVHRMRPNDAGLTQALIAHSPDWSFPSDHSAASFAIASALWFQHRKKLAAALVVAAVALGTSRVFVGVHYVSDVLGGAIVGLMAAYGVSKSFKENNNLRRGLVRLF
jgi:undecaprenyl-diphosphatase